MTLRSNICAAVRVCVSAQTEAASETHEAHMKLKLPARQVTEAGRPLQAMNGTLTVFISTLILLQTNQLTQNNLHRV